MDFVLRVFDGDFDVVFALQEPGQNVPVDALDEVSDIFWINQLRRLEHALEQLGASQLHSDPRQLRSEFFTFVLDAMTVLARNARVFEKGLFASAEIALKCEDLLGFNVAAESFDALIQWQ